MSNKKIAAELLKVAKGLLADSSNYYDGEPMKQYKEALATLKKLENAYNPEKGTDESFRKEIWKLSQTFGHVAGVWYSVWSKEHTENPTDENTGPFGKGPRAMPRKISRYCSQMQEQLEFFYDSLKPKIVKFPTTKTEDFSAPPMP